MRTVRSVFMKEWSAMKSSKGELDGKDGAERLSLANKAWLESETRAQILAARTNRQF